MTINSSPHIVPMVQLTPRDWTPNPQLTGGSTPPETLHIPQDQWLSLGEPSSIEDYYEKLKSLGGEPFLNTVNFRGFQSL